MAIFQNKATLTYNGVTIDSNVVTGEIIETLTLTKTALNDSYNDEPIVYAVSLVNDGTVDYTGVILNDDLGGYLFNDMIVYPLEYVDGSVRYFIDGAIQPAPAVTSGAGLQISGITVPAGGNTMILYSTRVTEYAPRGAGEGITNTVMATGGGLITALCAEATVMAQEGAQLSIIKCLSPNVVPENRRITYTFVINNNGNTATDPAADIVLNDLFDPALSDIVVTLDGVQLSEGTGYTYDQASGQFAIVAGVITVPAATITQDGVTGAFTVTPGSAVLTVEGTI